MVLEVDDEYLCEGTVRNLPAAKTNGASQSKLGKKSLTNNEILSLTENDRWHVLPFAMVQAEDQRLWQAIEVAV